MAEKNTSRKIEVFAHWQGMPAAQLMGYLYAVNPRGKEVFSFEYSEAWLKNGNTQALDPDLILFPGKQYLPDDKPNFGLFLDSSPDRWGRNMMKKREAILARKEGRKPALLTELDYLLGVGDFYRRGALQFKIETDGTFVKDTNEPCLTTEQLPELENACMKLEQDEINTDDERLKWLNRLMLAGASLGGSRPKAGVRDEQGSLWIAKFPTTTDLIDVAAWQIVTQELAFYSGINIPPAKLRTLNGKHRTFLTKRFDRAADGVRIHFASAMTLLGNSDKTDEPLSYLDLAGFIIRHGAKVDASLEELWRRIVFNICIKNCDDHLRNHGFIHTRDGWLLAPAYDLNPDPLGTGLSLNISEDDNSLSLELALDMAPYFRVAPAQAQKIIDKVKTTVANWRKLATKYKLPPAEQDEMASAFWE